MKSSNARITLAAILLAISTAVPLWSHAGDRDDDQRKRILGTVIGASVGAVIASQVGNGNKLAGAAIGAVGGYVVGNAVSNRDSRRREHHYSHRGEPRNWNRHDSRSPRHEGYRPGVNRHHLAPGARAIKPHRPHRTHDRRHIFQASTAVHVRQGPGQNYRSVGVLSRGAPVQVVRNSARNNWVLVARGGRNLGYVYAPLLVKARPHARTWNPR